MHVLAYTCTHVCACAHAQVCVVDVGVGWVSSVSLYFICGDLLLNPKLADLATLAGQFALGILSLSPGCWDY